MYYLTFLEAGSWNQSPWGYSQGVDHLHAFWMVWEENLFTCLFQLLEPTFLGWGPLPLSSNLVVPISASVGHPMAFSLGESLSPASLCLSLIKTSVIGRSACGLLPQSCLTLCDPLDFSHYSPAPDQDPLSMGFSRQEHWSGLPFPPPGAFPNLGIKPASPMSPALASRFSSTSTTYVLLYIY